MSRFELGGKGEPIPTVALPDPNLNETLPPKVLVLEDGVPFVKTDWVGLGYTHYEVWCVGAAGGRGGDGGGRGYLFGPHGTPENGITALALSWPYYFAAGIQHVHDPEIRRHDTFGGAGGGGGLHVVAGLLADLPDSCEVEVGQAGADAPIAQIAQPNPILSKIATTYEEAAGPIGAAGWPYFPGAVYDLPHTIFSPPVAGGDGGASSFNGDTCQASGGRGGHPSAVWEGTSLAVDGEGGAGGSGGRIAAGGGAAGSTIEDVDGADGTWDGTIGKGGGGGHGGMNLPLQPESGPVTDWSQWKECGWEGGWA